MPGRAMFKRKILLNMRCRADVNSYQLFAVNFDKNLSWNTHTDRAVSKGNISLHF